MVLGLNYHKANPPLRKNYKKLLKDFPFSLPKRYLNVLEDHDGGRVDYDFNYYDENFGEKIDDGIGVIFGLSHKNNLIEEYKTLPDFFPKKLVPFAKNGGGDFVCFDYRESPETNDPPVVFWSHDAENGKDVSFISENFVDFLSALYEPKENIKELSDEEFEKWLASIPNKAP